MCMIAKIQQGGSIISASGLDFINETADVDAFALPTADMNRDRPSITRRTQVNAPICRCFFGALLRQWRIVLGRLGRDVVETSKFALQTNRSFIVGNSRLSSCGKASDSMALPVDCNVNFPPARTFVESDALISRCVVLIQHSVAHVL